MSKFVEDEGSTKPPTVYKYHCDRCNSNLHYIDSCPFKKIVDGKVVDKIIEDKIIITEFGESIIPIYESSLHKSKNIDIDIISGCFAIHWICNGFVDIKEVSETHNMILCRKCHLRIVIPNTIKTYGELKKYFSGKAIY